MLAPAAGVTVVGRGRRDVARRADHRLAGPRGRRRSGSLALPFVAGRVRCGGRSAARPRSPAPLGRPRVARHARDGAARRGEPSAVADVVPAARGPAPAAARAARPAGGRGDPGRRTRSASLHGAAAVARPLPPRAAHGGRVRPVRPDAAARSSSPSATSCSSPRRSRISRTRRTRRSARCVGASPGPAAVPDRRGVLHDAPYQEGDDLRRIHWPSVARTGELMIRQDESTGARAGWCSSTTASRRSGVRTRPGVRARGLGRRRASGAARSQRIRAAARHAGRAAGRDVRGAVPGCARRRCSHAEIRSIGAGPRPPARRRLSGHVADLRLGAARAAELPVAVERRRHSGRSSRSDLPGGSGHRSPARRAQLGGRATQARLAFTRAGWDCLVLTPTMRLNERWHIRGNGNERSRPASDARSSRSRLVAAAVGSRSVACSWAGATYRIMLVGIASGVLAWAFERRSLAAGDRWRARALLIVVLA